MRVIILVLLLTMSCQAIAHQTSSLILDPSAPDGQEFMGERVGVNQEFLIKRYGNHEAKIVVKDRDKILCFGQDISIDVRSSTGLIHFTQGETYKTYSFYLSPDHRYLFLVRGIADNLCVAYAYKRFGTTMKLITIGGLRLDLAALKAYCSKQGLDYRRLANGAENAEFREWKENNHLRFWLFASSDLENPLSSALTKAQIVVDCNLGKNSFLFSAPD